MTTNMDNLSPERQMSFWFRVGQTLFLIAMAVAFYMLGTGMVHNRYFQGGHMDRHSHISR